MRSIVCSHGFGVRADDRGLFTDIAQGMPNHTFITFDYNTVDADGNITVAPFGKQSNTLHNKIKEAENADTIIAHSQGCITASLTDLDGVERVIFLAPPAELNIETFMRTFDRPGACIDLAGSSSIPRRDGTTTFVHKDYIDNISSIDIPQLYMQLANRVELIIIRATNDEILGKTQFNYLDGVQIIDMPASHDFTGEFRLALIDNLRKILTVSE